jgi:hypothetical protein
MAFPFVPAALGLASVLGGLFGGPKGIDMKEWEKLFGPEAVGAKTNEFMKLFQNSPWARQQQVQASNTGQQVANTFASMPGARQSGVGQISQSLATGATSSLEQQLMSMLFQMAQQSAQQHLGDKQNVFLHNQQQPSFLQQLGQAVSGAAGQTLSMLPTGKQAATAPASGKFWDTTTQGVPSNENFTPQNNALTGDSRFDVFANRAVGGR